jgi:8-oxo-dGTP diphosphatase
MNFTLAPDLTAAIAVDIAVFTFRDDGAALAPQERVEVLLFKRGDMWTLPGALVRVNESFETAARRGVAGKTGYDPADWYLEQLATFGSVDRDSRGRVISVGHIALARREELLVVDETAAKDARWFPLSGIPWGDLGWDHPNILKTAIQRLRSKLRYSWVAFELLPNPFAISDLRDLYAAFYGDRVAKLSTSNFLKGFRPLLECGELIPAGDVERNGRRGRPSTLYRFSGTPDGTRGRELPW